jgi:hypothetical protein
LPPDAGLEIANIVGTSPLLQLRVLGFGLLQDWYLGVGVFPKSEEVLIGSLRFGIVPPERERAGQA